MLRSDKELADALDARDRLINRGYVQKACDKCKGLGRIQLFNKDNDFSYTECFRCEGKGFWWKAPYEVTFDKLKVT
jgi:DnaJ-class molecular chaperone